MEEKGIITGYSTFIDTFKLGYSVFRLYLKFQDIPIKTKQRVIDCFVNYKNSWSVYSCTGSIDLGSVIWIDNVYDFYKFYNGIITTYGNYFSEKIISIYIRADEYEKTYLLYDKPKENRMKYTIICDGKHVKIDGFDYKLLNIIVENARIQGIELAKKLKTSSQTINYRINNLIKSNIIKSFRVDVDYSKIGYQHFDVRINLRDNTKRQNILEYIKTNPNFKCLNTSIGYCELEIEYIVESMDRINEIIDDLELKYPDSIRSYFFFKTRQKHKERWLPEMSEEDFKKK